jgi:multiple PDZ domain protein
VCGESLRHTSHERAIQILRQTPSVVKLVVLREVEVLGDSDMYDTISVDLVKKRNAGLGFSIVNRPSGIFISDLVRMARYRSQYTVQLDLRVAVFVFAVTTVV